MRLIMTMTACLFISATQAAEWRVQMTCSAATPGEDAPLTMVASHRVDDKGKPQRAVQLRVRTPEIALAKAEKGTAQIEIPGQGSFGPLSATGLSTGNSNVAMITTEADLLPAISRGATMDIVLTGTGGNKKVSINLAGSAEAIKQLSVCLR